jgi:hypothetical protein
MNGPIFLVFIFMEAYAERARSIELTGSFDAALIGLRMNRAINILACLIGAQFLQQREFSIVMIKQKLVER